MAQKNLHTVQQILNSMRAAAYVINSETHEILFVNKNAKYLSGGKIKPGKKCWEVLQNNQSAPCSFCKLDKLFSIVALIFSARLIENQNE